MERRFKVKLNSVEVVESILQEIYDDSVRQINLIQKQIICLGACSLLFYTKWNLWANNVQVI